MPTARVRVFGKSPDERVFQVGKRYRVARTAEWPHSCMHRRPGECWPKPFVRGLGWHPSGIFPDLLEARETPLRGCGDTPFFRERYGAWVYLARVGRRLERRLRRIPSRSAGLLMAEKVAGRGMSLLEPRRGGGVPASRIPDAGGPHLGSLASGTLRHAGRCFDRPPAARGGVQEDRIECDPR